MEALRIEPLREDDWPAVVAIYREGIETRLATFETEVPEWSAWDGAHLPEHRLVARAGDKVVGWAALTPVSRRAVYKGVADLSVYVATVARGRGIGRALLAALTESARAGGLWTLQAGVFPENEASLALHRSVGFRDVGVRERIGRLDGVWRDVVLLELPALSTAIREVRASGLEYLALVTELLQRARLADSEAGLWEAADLQWWWRTPRRSDAIDHLFWVDDDGPVAAAVLTEWRRGWACDPILVAGVPAVPLSTVVARATERIEALGLGAVETLVRDDDVELQSLLARAGFVADEDDRSGSTWMNAQDRAGVAALPEGFVLVDRTLRREIPHATPHPMRSRSGADVEARLRQCSLYDPALDLAIETADGAVAGYSLYWFDPVTEVGLLEPMRVEDAYQRRGLARAMLTEGLDRLAKRGARRLKVGYATDVARDLYVGAGFRVTETSTTYVMASRV